MEEAMPDTTSEFFDGLARRGHDPSLEKATGTLRFDLADDGKTARWKVTIAKGDLSVSREKGEAKADAVVHADKQTFEDIVSGELNPVAAMLRGKIGVEGDPELVVLFQRLFRGVSA
jgi:putative sterol carrier protein